MLGIKLLIIFFLQIPNDTSNHINELFYKSIFSIQFIKFMYSKKFFVKIFKLFKCVSWTNESRYRKIMKELKLKSLEEVEIVEKKLTYAVLAHFMIPSICSLRAATMVASGTRGVSAWLVLIHTSLPKMK